MIILATLCGTHHTQTMEQETSTRLLEEASFQSSLGVVDNTEASPVVLWFCNTETRCRSIEVPYAAGPCTALDWTGLDWTDENYTALIEQQKHLTRYLSSSPLLLISPLLSSSLLLSPLTCRDDCLRSIPYDASCTPYDEGRTEHMMSNELINQISSKSVR